MSTHKRDNVEGLNGYKVQYNSYSYNGQLWMLYVDVIDTERIYDKMVMSLKIVVVKISHIIILNIYSC